MALRAPAFITALLMLVGCYNSTDSTENQAAETTDAIEVVYFHGKMKCKTCIAIGDLSQKTVQQIGDSGIVWKEIDCTTADGEKFADKHELVGSGLMVVNNGKSTNLTEIAFRYALSDTAKFKSELTTAIDDIKE